MTDADETRALAIYLGSDRVGTLALGPNDETHFRLLPSYTDLPRRPVLGQVFEDDPYAVHRARMRLPPFFSNLLPEGRLRMLVADLADVAPEREYFMLARLGEDLPGDVRATPIEPFAGDLPSSTSIELHVPPDALKFSLAGVQLKLSMIREGKGMTLPANGLGGDWIVKLPGTQFIGVPENEFTTMSWARLVGIDVPQVELIPVSQLRGLPVGLDAQSGMAFAVRRFDRPVPGKRIHIEDFAQVRNRYPDYKGKYASTNYETLGKIILRIAGRDAFDEFVRRLAFITITANADAHVKNWSLIYPDRYTPKLSPAYDLVSTVEFIEHDALALNLGKTKAWDQLSVGHFSYFAQRVGVDPAEVISLVQQVAQRTLDEWTTVRRDYPVSAVMTARLEGHWRRLPLISELGGGARSPG